MTRIATSSSPALDRRRVLAGAAAIAGGTLLGSAPRSARAALPAPPPHWAGVNHGTGFFLSEPFLTTSLQAGNALGLKAIRWGINGVGGSTEGGRFTWTNRDAAMARYRAAGYQIHGVISFREHVLRGTSMTQWERNWRYFARNVMSHYRDDVRYWIIDNEPEKGFGNYYPTPAETVKFTRIAFEEFTDLGLQDRCMIESPPVASPETDYLRQMLELGLADYCHVIGCHCYGDQIQDKRIRKLWDRLAAVGATDVAAGISECGAPATWAPTGYPGGAEAWRAYYHRQFRVAAKSFGFEYALIFSLDRWKVSLPEWGLAVFDATGATYTARQPVFNALRDSWGAAKPFGNGGFESPEDGKGDWMIRLMAPVSNPIILANISFPSNAAIARSGSGCCRMTLAGHNKELVVRQVADQLIPGRTYRVEAYAFLTGGTATLKARGYNRLRGTDEIAASTTTRGVWTRVAVDVTPSNPWVVVELGTTGTKKVGEEVRWDDVTVSEVVA
jgi:hypothetical protein